MTPTPIPTLRVLPDEDYPRLLAFEPFATGGLPSPAVSRILVAELGGDIVGFWGLFNAVHVEPLWIHPDHRSRPGLIRRLWTAVQSELRAAGVFTAFACIADRDAAQNVPLALRQGFERVPGDLYMIRLASPEKES